VKCKFKAPLQKGIITLAFSPSGTRLVAGAIDVDHCMAIFDVVKGVVLWSDKGGPDVIIDVRFANEDSFVTVGVKHYKFWTYSGGKCSGDKGNFGKEANNKLAGIGINGSDVICGAADG
jgi:microtubule-associated protein-like 6